MKTAATPPTLTSVAPVRLVPVNLFANPPAREPEVTCTEEIVGAVRYVNPPVKVAFPLGVVTMTSFAPGVPDDGVTNATDVSEITLMLVAADPPTVIPDVPVKPVPRSTEA